ncbi:FAD:protein FMN transferase [Ruminococcaceae bacterium OttesenSCG-928-L11]|nr:FAD:protein FMN transferase [Ruminococcaceae bacterium OttesenSCG-928-L11]
MKYRIGALLICGILLAGLLPGCTSGQSEPVFRTKTDVFGTVIQITLHAYEAEDVLDAVFERMDKLHALLTVNAVDSDVGRINQNPGRWTEVDPVTVSLVETALRYARLSDGAFDCTIAPVTTLWGFPSGMPSLPEPAAIREALAQVDYTRLETRDRAVRTASPGMAIDLGGIAKGYACDEAAALLRQQGVTSAILDFGGNVYALGNKPDGSLWKVGLQTPVAGAGGIIGHITCADKAIVTSGGYERWFEENGVTYHHILDPATGYPADSGLLSATIVTDSATNADALSTACFVLGVEEGLALIAGLDGVEAIFVTTAREVIVTDGLQTAFTLTDETFTRGKP